MKESKIDLIGLCCVRLKYLEIPWLTIGTYYFVSLEISSPLYKEKIILN